MLLQTGLSSGDTFCLGDKKLNEMHGPTIGHIPCGSHWHIEDLMYFGNQAGIYDLDIGQGGFSSLMIWPMFWLRFPDFLAACTFCIETSPVSAI